MAVQLEAVKICTSLEHQVLEGDHRDAGEIERMHTAWQRVAPHAKDEMVQRYQRVCDRLAAPAPVISQPPVEIETKTVTKETEAPITNTEEPAAPQVNEALARLCEDIKVYETENAEHPGASSLNKLKQQLEKTWKHCSRLIRKIRRILKQPLIGLENLKRNLKNNRSNLKRSWQGTGNADPA